MTKRRWIIPFTAALFVLAVLAAVGVGDHASAQTPPGNTTGGGTTDNGEVSPPIENLNVKPQGSASRGSLQTVDANGNKIYCTSLPAAQGGFLVSRIVPCMLNTVQSATVKFSQKMINWLRPLLYAFLTFVIAMYGLRVLQGEPEIHKHGVLLLIKVSIVIAVLDSIPSYYVPATYNIMAESVGVVSDTIMASGSSSLHCTDMNPAYHGLKLWSIMDCVLGKLYGFSTGAGGGGNMILASSMFGLLSGFFFGGAWGVTIFFGLIGVLISIFMLVIRTILAFINGYLVISILLILCPLFMPLVFMRGTAQYFEKVWKNILASFLMPVIVAAYAMMALLMYDKMLFADNSLMKTLFDYNKIKDALEKPKKVCDRPITGDARDVRFEGARPENGDDAMRNKFLNPFLQNTIMPTLSAANDPCAMANVPVFNVNSINDPEFQKGRDTYVMFFEQLLQLLVLGWLIAKGQQMVMDTIPLLVGGAAATTAMGATMASEFKLTSSLTMAGKKFEAGLSGTSGAAFLSRIPPAGGDALKDFLSGITRKG